MTKLPIALHDYGDTMAVCHQSHHSFVTQLISEDQIHIREQCTNITYHGCSGINWIFMNDATYFIVLLIGSTCFRRYYAHHQELTTIMLITTLVVSFCKDGGGSVNVKLWFLVVYVPFGLRR